MFGGRQVQEAHKKHYLVKGVHIRLSLARSEVGRFGWPAMVGAMRRVWPHGGMGDLLHHTAVLLPPG